MNPKLIKQSPNFSGRVPDTEYAATFIFFYKQPVYKQLALKWQIAKQFSMLSPLSLSNNKNCRLEKH